MSRLFNDAASQHLEIAQALVTAPPFSIAAWFNSDDGAVGNQAILSVSKNDVDDQLHRLIAIASATDRVAVQSRDTTNFSTAISTTVDFTVGAWHHACGVWSTTTSRSAYQDGANKATNTDSREPAAMNRTAIGRTSRLTALSYFSGMLAEVAVWNVALSDAEVALLATGVLPLRVQPSALISYVPLWGQSSPEIDVRSGASWTVTGATAAAHPTSVEGAGKPIRLLRHPSFR